MLFTLLLIGKDVLKMMRWWYDKNGKMEKLKNDSFFENLLEYISI